MKIINKDSYNAHNEELKLYTYDFCKEQQKTFRESKIEYDADKSIGRLLDDESLVKSVRIGVDIGSGHGYFAALMSGKMDKVYAIEPSEAGIEMSKRLHSEHPNIEWIVGFGEEQLPKLSLEGPAIFHTGCVLSHLEDDSVIDICEAIDKIALPNSVLSFCELWGFEHHEHLWHCRGASWWKQRFPNWKFNFIENNVQVPYRYKSFTAVKQ